VEAQGVAVELLHRPATVGVGVRFQSFLGLVETSRTEEDVIMVAE